MRRRGATRKAPTRSAGEELQRQLAVYQVLHDRYVSNAGLQWQVAVYIIAAQAALLAGVVAARSLPLSLFLAVANAVVGIGGILVCRRIELTGSIDREHLDELEAIIAGGQPEFRLYHGDTFGERLERRGLSRSDANLIRRLDLKIARRVRPGIGLAIVMTALGATSLLAAIVGP